MGAAFTHYSYHEPRLSSALIPQEFNIWGFRVLQGFPGFRVSSAFGVFRVSSAFRV